MFTTAFIALREFLEAFLIVGIFLGVSRKLQLKKEKEIIIAAVVGFGISFMLSIATYFLGGIASTVLTEENAEVLSSYLMIFSGFFLAYVIVSLHDRIGSNKKEIIAQTSEKLENKTFDISLFMTITFLVAKEGFEIALFTASASLFTVFIQNVIGLCLGFCIAAMFGLGTFFAFIKLPIKKIFTVTEFMIIIFGALMIQMGIVNIFSLQQYIFVRVVIVLFYITGIYFIFNEKKNLIVK